MSISNSINKNKSKNSKSTSKDIDLATEFENWFSEVTPQSLLTAPSAQDKKKPCQTDFFRKFYRNHLKLYKDLESFYLNYFEVNEQPDRKKFEDSYFKEYDKFLKAEQKKFKKYLDSANSSLEKAKKSRLQLLKFKARRKLAKNLADETNRYNFEILREHEKKMTKQILLKSPAGFDSTKFSKDAQEKSYPGFIDKLTKTISMMRFGGLRGLFILTQEDPNLKADKSPFLAPFKRYEKYNDVKSKFFELKFSNSLCFKFL